MSSIYESDVHVASISDKEDWDRVITGQGGGMVHHLWDSSTAIQAHLRCKLLRFVYKEDGNIKGIFPLYLVHTRRPANRSEIMEITRSHRPLVGLLHILKNVAYLRTTWATSSPLSTYGGPLFSHDADRTFKEYFIKNVTQNLKDLAKVRSVNMLLSPKSSQDYALIRSLMRNGYSPIKMQVCVLYLTIPLDKIFENFDKKTRNACRQAIKRGAYVVEAEQKEVEECYKMYSLSFQRQGKSPPIDSDLFLKICHVLL